MVVGGSSGRFSQVNWIAQQEFVIDLYGRDVAEVLWIWDMVKWCTVGELGMYLNKS